MNKWFLVNARSPVNFYASLDFPKFQELDVIPPPEVLTENNAGSWLIPNVAFEIRIISEYTDCNGN